jgi:hypothetical protein
MPPTNSTNPDPNPMHPIRPKSHSFATCAKYLVALFVVAIACSAALAQSFPTPTPVVTSSQVPPDVSIPQNFPGNAIAFFDDYSWRAFVALVWPAQQGQRGVPDPNQTVGGPGPRVFETFKSLNEVFHNDGTAPAAWNNFDPPQYNPCGIAMGWGDLTLGSFSKFSDLGQAGFGSLVGPLIAQNTTYVRFLTAYNQPEFQQILDAQWYLRCNLPQQPPPCPSPGPASITFNVGSLDVKSSWMEMTGVKQPNRYYTRTASVLDPVSGKCSQILVGLVGLHIVQKTPTRPQWIWSSFEQVDNLPSGGGAPFGPGTGNFNSGKPPPMPANNPYDMHRVLLIPTAAPFNVSRVNPIHTSTQATNKAYQNALTGTVWQNYQLVMTQWPVPGNTPANNGNSNHSFPGTINPGDNTTAFANTTMETFDQAAIFKSCMACHTVTQTATDFLWSLNDHAFPAKKGTPNLVQNPAFRELINLMAKEAPSEKKQSPPKKSNPPKK